ncbi:TPA: hypothetical protein MAC86_002391 [Klebsiella pneumoniae]|nr:hypothetical protein [Klebsiella pneumoniae]
MKEIALPLHPAPARVWIAVVALGICAFSIVTSELAPVGMLSALAADFHQTESGVGLAVTAYGWVGALAALLSGAMPTRISRKALLGGLYGATACIITAHFAAFTYIEPLLINLQGVPATALSGLLLLSGVSGLLGNVIAGKLIDRHLKGLIFAALLLSGGALALLGAARLAPLPFCFSGLLLALWGTGIAIVFVGLQTWLLRSAGAVAQPASAIYVAIFNAAIGTGAFVGGQLIASAGLSGMVWLAAGIMVGSTLLIALLKAPLPGQIGAATAGA